MSNPKDFKLPIEFHYEFFEKNRYIMPKQRPILGGLEYEAMCNNGYIKLYTYPGKIYWLIQNENSHLTPDWKFHISVIDEDLKKAFNIVSEIFIKMQCKSGMKVKYLKENKLTVRGREITVYICVYDTIYEKSEIGEEFGFNPSIQQDEEFWYEFYDEVEKRLKENKVRSNGTAKGDLALGEYISIRNEAYVFDKSQEIDIYPKDSHGWNAKNHLMPFNLVRFKRVKERSGMNYLLIIVSLMVILLSYLTLKN